MSYKKKIILLILLLMTILFRYFGYAVLAKSLNISSTSNINAKWNVEIVDIKLEEKDGIKEIEKPKFDNKTASFNVSLNYPGAFCKYKIKIKNSGTIPAYLTEITGIKEINNTEPIQIKYSIEKTSNDVINSGEIKEYVLKVEWPINDDKIIKKATKKAIINFNYIQSNE